MSNMTNANAYKLQNGPFAGRMAVDVDTTGKTLTIADSGYVQNVIADGIVINVPATATHGEWPILCGGVKVTSGPKGALTGNKGQLVQVSPVAADQIQGGVDGTAVDNKDLILAKLSSKVDDYVVVRNTGETNGPIVSAIRGAWAREA